MYIKWIICNVKKNFEKEFSLAQGKWIKMKNTPGLIGQIGGWDLIHTNIACVISFWENEKSLKAFMHNIHDEIFLNSDQSEYYNSIKVDYFKPILNIEGECNSILNAIKRAKLLRIADCVVKQGKVNHFEIAQKEIWLPEMKNNKGMFGSRLSKCVNNPSRYLVSTFWSSLENHKRYVEINLPGLKVKADVQNDIDDIIVRQILLIDTWKIL